MIAGQALAEVSTVAPRVDVVGATPVPGLDQPRDEIPAPVQSLDGNALRSGTSLPDLLGGRVNGVNVNEIQGNPFQADVNFRGFSASPLLGTPQGLSVYQDGVRINEPFGDTVNWDLVPRVAIERIDLVPGANPLFGLNTLGGALALRTRSGFTSPGAELAFSAGSFGRRNLDFEYGHKGEGTGFYAAGTLFREDGWRDASPSEVKQFFAKLSRQTGGLDLDLSLTHGDTDLVGNGLAPESMLARRRAEIFTKPDNTLNRMTLASLGAAWWLSDSQRLSATAYVRRNTTRTLNGDANDQFEGDPALDGDAGANGGAGFNADTAAANRTRTRQRSAGGALQWAHLGESSQTALGLTFDRSRADFEQTTELGVFDAWRGVAVTGAPTLDTLLDGHTRHWSLFATHTFRPAKGLVATLSGRFNRSHVQSTDRLNPGVANNLDGDFVYSKFNPAAGLTYALSPTVTLYANAAQGNRAPSPIELGCADPNNPCSLPNAMQADPYLKQVVTRSLEMGLRGRLGEAEWNAGVFRATNHDDILFVGTSTSQGYFTNFGRTRREGVELGASGRNGPFSWRAQYGYVRATYQSPACVLAENNSTRGQSAECTAGGQDDEILVSPGNRLPGIPAHSLKLGLDWKGRPGWVVSAEMQAYSSQYVRGNENNAHQAGTFSDILGGGPRTFLGPGKLPGHAVVNLALRGDLGGGWEATARIANLFDRRYTTAGALAENPFNAAGGFQTNSADWTRETFVSPGAPRSAWLGVHYRFR
jgi:outer membrane receptor protein involved in Fe transport